MRRAFFFLLPLSSQADRPRTLRWLGFWYFSYFAFLGAFGTYFSLYLTALGVTPWGIGVILSLQPVMRLLAPNFWGWVADRYGLGARLVGITIAACCVVLAVVPTVRDFPTLAFLLLLQAFFWSASLPLVEALTLFHLSHRIEHYGRIRLWGSIGFIVAVQAVGILLDVVEVSWLPWICWGLVLLTLVFSLPLRDGGARETAVAIPSFRSVLRRPEVGALFVAAFLMSAAHAPLYVFYSVHLVAHGYAKSLVGLFWALGVVAEIVVFMQMPRLMRWGGIRQVLLWSHALATLRFLLIGWMIDQSWIAVAAQLMHGATFGAAHASCIAALSRWFPGAQQSRAHSLYSSLSFGGGGVVGGLLAGYLWQSRGAGVCYSVAAGFALLGGLVIWRGMVDGADGHAENQSKASGGAV